MQQAGSNVLLTWVPHEKTHGPMTINRKMLEAGRERERKREIQIVHSASLTYEDESAFTFCALLRMAVRQWLTAF